MRRRIFARRFPRTSPSPLELGAALGVVACLAFVAGYVAAGIV